MFEIIALLLGRFTWVGWIVALFLLALLVIWGVGMISASQPDVSGTPAEIVARWNAATQGVSAPVGGPSLRASFERHLRELHEALARGNEDAEEDARERLAEDFEALRALRRQQGLGP